MNKLTKLYAGILQSVDCTIDPDGVVLYDDGQGQGLQPIRLHVDGKKRTLVLPTKGVLKDANWDEVVAFHPACENVFAGQSEVLNCLINLCNLKLYMSTQIAVNAMIDVAQDEKKHAKLNLSQMKLITPLSGVSKTVFKYLTQIVKRSTGISGERPLLCLHLARGRKVGDVKYKRVCTLQTPILDEPMPLYGIKGSSKNESSIMTAYQMVFPEEKAVGSNSKDTPYLEALLEMFYITAVHLNTIKSTLGKFSGAMKTIDVSWFPEIVNLHKYKTTYIPQSLPGNVGVGKSKETSEVVGGTSTGAVDITKPPAPRSSTPGEGSSIAEALNASAMATPNTLAPITTPVFTQAPAIQSPTVSSMAGSIAESINAASVAAGTTFGAPMQVNQDPMANTGSRAQAAMGFQNMPGVVTPNNLGMVVNNGYAVDLPSFR